MADDEDFVDLDEVDFGETIRGHQPGDTVFDRFTMRKLIGRGGMGVVWLAGDERLDREVALKFTPDSVLHDEKAVEELKKETLRGLNLAHPNIVRFFDFLQDDRFAAISMEFVDGETIGRLRVREESKVFQPDRIERWIRQMFAALDYAHRTARIVHRDLKPANLLINREGDLKITDFGIAASISESLSRTTGASAAMTGTLAYMSPQQAQGAAASIDDDIYSLGCTLYELFTGKPPFYTGNIAIQVEDEVPPPIHKRRAEFKVQAAGTFPARWEEMIQACLAKNPADRPSSIEEVAQGLGIQTGVIADAGEPIASSSGDLTRAANLTSMTQSTSVAGSDSVGVTIHATGNLTNLTAAATAEGAGSGDGARDASKKKPLLKVALMVAGLALVGGALFAFQGAFFGADTGSEPGRKRSEIDPKIEAPKIEAPKTEAPKTEDPKGDNDQKVVSTAPVDPDSPFTVPGKFSTIQAAIDSAKSGDVITIAKGTYEEALTLRNGVHLEASKAGEVIVQVDGNLGSALMIKDCQQGSVVGISFRDRGLLKVDPDVVANKSKVYPLVHVVSSSVDLSECDFIGIGDGIIVTGAGTPTLTRCKAFNNTLSGFKIERGVQARLENCQAESNGDHGFVVAWNGSAEITHSKASKNGKSGFYLEAEGSADLNYTSSVENTDAGIILFNGGNTLKMLGGDVSNNEQMGITTFNQTQSGSVTLNGGSNLISLDSVTVEKNKTEAGIWIEFPEPDSHISYCVLNDNAGFGIYVGGAAGHGISLDNNKVRGSIDGILLEGADLKVTATGNMSTTNAQYGINVQQGVVGEISQNKCPENGVGAISPSSSTAGLILQGNSG